jgi:malonyl-CoA decarboxylase
MTFFADLMATLFERRSAGASWFSGDSRPIAEEIDALLSGKGEVSGARLAHDILSRYRAMNDAARRDFFDHLARHLDLDPDHVITAAEAYRSERSAENLSRLTGAAEPRRQELLRRLNQASGATEALVGMRRDLLRLMRDVPELGVIDPDFRHLFVSWFNRGFLVLRQIDWRTPANILEKIIQYEAVHAINDWQELRRRVLPHDRRCFAFFHPSMPEEPLIFVEVALSRGVPGSIQTLLSEDREILDAGEADTAVFYSISNCQEGLRGVSFGNLLIKQVVEELSHELAGLKTFVTLSPIPGLNRWLRQRAEGDAALAEVLSRAESRDAVAIAGDLKRLRQLAAEYLVAVKQAGGLPADPVARFHLSNGALVHDIHALADTSANGWDQSSSLMVNYLYDPAQVGRNSERHAADGFVAVSRQVGNLVSRSSKGKSP